MTNLEIIAIKTIAERLLDLASLENACFDHNNEKDEYIKSKIRPYMSWFEGCAYYLEDIIDLSENKKGWYKKEKLEEIIRLST